MKLYVSSYHNGHKKGLYTFDYNKNDQTISEIQFIPTRNFPSYIIRNENYIYVALKDSSNDKSGGGIQIYDSNNMSLVDDYISNGTSYTHLNLSCDSTLLVGANFHGGSVDTFDLVCHKLSPLKQSFNIKGSNIHYVGITPKRCYAIDLTLNNIYQYDIKDNLLSDTDVIKVSNNQGPRHMTFDNKFEHAYVINEVANTINVYNIDSNGNLQLLQNINVLESIDVASLAAGIKLSACQKYIFASNRGADCITVLKRDTKSGTLEFLFNQKCKKTPRDLCLIDDLVFVACQDSDCIEIYRFDSSNDTLTLIKCDISIPNPVCITD